MRNTALLALLSACIAAWATEPARAETIEGRSIASTIKPDAFLAQLGVADEVTAGTAGAIWNIRWDALDPRFRVCLEA
jgi:hypothetical protein